MKKNSAGQIYNQEYFFSQCEGYIQFHNSRGKVLGKRLKKIMDLAALRPEERVVDIGCGRGELVLHCAQKKARALGIDKSEAALSICNSTLNFWSKKDKGIKDFAAFLHADASSIPVEDMSVDVVFLIDFVEHLTKKELRQVFREINRILKDGSRLIIHTSPNRYYLPLMGRILALISKIRSFVAWINGGKAQSLPWNIRPLLPRGLHSDIHCNEVSSWTLRWNLKKNGLKVENMWFQLNPHYIDFFFADSQVFKFINWLRRILPIRHLFYADILCVARK